MQEVTTKEELLLTMKDNVITYWTYLIQTQTKMGERLKEIQNDHFEFEDITCWHPENGECPEYKVAIAFNGDMTQYKNNLRVIEDLTKMVTIMKEELYNKEFTIFLENKDGTRMTAWLSSEEIKESNNIEELVKEEYPEY